MKDKVFIKKFNSDEPITGVVWPGTTVFPDFTNPNTTLWWTYLANKFHNVIPFDGIWIVIFIIFRITKKAAMYKSYKYFQDMNEPSSFIDGSETGCIDSNLFDNPPFVPKVLGDQLFSRTICPSSRQYISEHYNLHNMYGHFEAIATFKYFNL